MITWKFEFSLDNWKRVYPYFLLLSVTSADMRTYFLQKENVEHLNFRAIVENHNSRIFDELKFHAQIRKRFSSKLNENKLMFHIDW